MKLIKLACNAVTAKLIDADREAKLLVSSILSYRVEGAEHMAAFKKDQWDGRSSFFNFRAGTFPAGFVHSVYNDLTANGYTVRLIRKPAPAPRGPVNPVVDTFGEDPRYDFQAETMNRLIKHRQMIAQVATGGGKSRIAKMVYARIKRPTLFLTTRSVLMYQMKDDFEKSMGIKVGIMGDSEWSPNSGMNVGMVQTLAPFAELKEEGKEIERFLESQHLREKEEIAKLKIKLNKKKANLKEINVALARLREQQKQKRPSDKYLADRVQIKVAKHNKRRDKVLKVLSIFEVVILEEAHEAGGNGFYELMRHCKNAHYRLSLTATPFMRDDEEANMRLMACSGPIGIRITEKLLIDRGILARPIFKYVNLSKPPKLYRTSPWQKAYKVGIVQNEMRNRHIVYEATRAAKYGLTSMCLVQHTAHGHAIKKLLTEAGLRAVFIYGKHEQTQRKEALKRLKEGSIDVLIGSTILDVGVDVPAVGVIILAGGGKAEVGLRQRIGRGLRCKVVGPNICLIIDFTDSHNTHIRDHARTRRSIVESIPGFVEGIILDDGDFNFEKLGLTV